MAKPKKDRRKHVVSCRVTEGEKKELQQLAAIRRESPSSTLHAALMTLLTAASAK